MALIILYLLYYVYTKDTSYSRNIRSVASVVEDLNRELYYLKKQLSQTESEFQANAQRMSDDEIYQEIERSVYDLVQPLSVTLKQLQSNIEMIEGQIEHRIAQLESGVKQISIPTSIHANDDEKIISLFLTPGKYNNTINFSTWVAIPNDFFPGQCFGSTYPLNIAVTNNNSRSFINICTFIKWPQRNPAFMKGTPSCNILITKTINMGNAFNHILNISTF